MSKFSQIKEALAWIFAFISALQMLIVFCCLALLEIFKEQDSKKKET